jgi:hypothetical protein
VGGCTHIQGSVNDTQCRGDADAKQGELRLMVGYVAVCYIRDHVSIFTTKAQGTVSSTSIISMAASSEHVVSVLEEMQDMIEDTEPEHRLQRTSASLKDGTTRSI